MKPQKLIRQIRWLTLGFILALVLSGLTAFPLQSEVDFIYRHVASFPSWTQGWIFQLHNTLQESSPILLYGTDWLGFAHLVIATFFIAVWIDPLKYKFNLLAGMTACAGIVPLALVMGPLRGIPFFHQCIDISFGLLGMLPLILIYRRIQRLEKEQTLVQRSNTSHQ